MIKSELFENELKELSEFSRIFSHPARLSILKYLSKCKTCISGDISNFIPLSRTTVSQHLQELKRIGLIKGEIEGLKIHYCIDTEKLNFISQSFTNFFKQILSSNNEQC